MVYNYEIKDVRLILPAFVKFKQDDQELTVFVYIDQRNKDVVIPDPTGIEDLDAFKQALAGYYNLKNPAMKQPILPKGVFEKLDPNNYKGDFNG